MIAHLRGKLVQKSTEFIVIEVNGVGFGLFISLTTFYELPDLHQEVFLWTHPILREDHVHLYGFLSEEEKRAFEVLIGISGIGPRLARNILSGITPSELGTAIVQEDVARLKAIPGVGRRTAERIIVELREKGDKITGSIKGPQPEKTIFGSLEEDVLSALVSLGYKRTLALQVIERICRSGQPFDSPKELLKQSLQELAR